jgi:Uma2 family endonuclease
MRTPKLDSNQLYTYADYETWDDGQRWELIDGVPYCMSPAPRIRHQRISIELSRQISNFLKDRECDVFCAPCDVNLPKPGETEETSTTILQPDLLVVCDQSKIKDKYIVGAPDWIIEILSPSTAKKDQKEKMRTYARAGVKEYWIVNPAYATITVFKLEDNKFIQQNIFDETDEIEVATLPGLKIIAKDVLPKIKRVQEDPPHWHRI